MSIPAVHNPVFGLFKQASKENWGTVTFFGVLHFGTADMYPLPPLLEDTIRKADVVAFETDLDAMASQSFNELMATRGTLPDTESLQNLLHSSIWERLTKTAGRLGFFPDALNTMRPWYCASLITSAALRQTGLDSCMGLDTFIYRKAQALQKVMLSLETPEQQLDILTGIDRAKTDEFMTQTLDEVDDMPKFTQNMLNLWLQADEKGLNSLIEEGFEENHGLQDSLLATRNQQWLGKLMEQAGLGKTVLAVVGAGHLVGPCSLPAQFMSQGFELKSQV